MQKIKMKRKGLRDVRITWKMLISSLIPAAILVLVWVLMVKTLDETKIGSPLYNEIMLSINLVADILPPPEYIIEPYLTELQFITTSDGAERTVLLQKFKQLEENYNKRYEYWVQTLTDQPEIQQSFLKDAHDQALRFFDIFHNQIVPAVNSEDSQTLQKAQKNLASAYEAHRAAVDKTVSLSTKWADDITGQAATSDASSKSTILIMVVCAVMVSLLLNFVVSQSMVKHVKYISSVNRRIADGELSATIEQRQVSSDEIGQLCLATSQILVRLNSYVDYINEITAVLDTMARGDLRVTLTKDYEGEFSPIKAALLAIAAALNKTMSVIRDSADRVNDDALQIDGGAQALARGAAEQAEAVGELVGSLGLVSGEATKNTLSVSQALELVNQSESSVAESTAQMNRLISAMTEINASANQISSIIKTIDDISFQTNILALNAAVEAARAGAAGKGFAVVADEVRNLATKSAMAASQTSSLITSTIKAIELGQTVTEETARALTAVKEKTENVQTIMIDISASSGAQEQQLQDVNVRLLKISDIVQPNSATAEKSADISQALSTQAQGLRYEIGRFKLQEMSSTQSDVKLLEYAREASRVQHRLNA